MVSKLQFYISEDDDRPAMWPLPLAQKTYLFNFVHFFCTKWSRFGIRVTRISPRSAARGCWRFYSEKNIKWSFFRLSQVTYRSVVLRSRFEALDSLPESELGFLGFSSWKYVWVATVIGSGFGFGVLTSEEADWAKLAAADWTWPLRPPSGPRCARSFWRFLASDSSFDFSRALWPE